MCAPTLARATFVGNSFSAEFKPVLRLFALLPDGRARVLESFAQDATGLRIARGWRPIWHASRRRPRIAGLALTCYERRMIGVELVKSNSTLLAIIVRADAKSDEKYNFLTNNDQPFQFGVNFYPPGEIIKGHAHLLRTTTVESIQEFILVSEGRMRLHVFDENDTHVADAVLGKGDSVLLLAGGHGFDMLEATKLVEVKQGPYDGKSKDKRVFG